MAISADTRLAGGMGTKYVSGTTAVTGLNHFMIVPRENTTITSITGIDGAGNTVNILTDMGLTVGVTLLKDEQWICKIDHTITGIQLATGTVRLH